jgi:hypothetical protein
MDADRALKPEDASTDTSVPTGEVLTGLLDPAAVPDLGLSPLRVPLRGSEGPVGGLGPEWLPSPPPGQRRPAIPDRPERARAGRRRLVLAYALVVVLLAVAVSVAFGARARLHLTDTQLTATRARLARTVTRAHRAETALGSVTAQSTAAARTLATETSQLASVEAQLAATEANVFADGVSIDDLDTCLSGVEQALNEISLDDQHGAASTLDGVAASCRAAEPVP